MSKANKTYKPQPVRKSFWARWMENPRSRRRFIIIGSLVFLGLMFMSLGFVTGTMLEEHNDFCASCHTVPETTYFNRANTAVADTTAAVSDLATMHFRQASSHNDAFQCITCHRGDSSLGDRIQTLLLGGRDTLVYITGKADPTIEKPVIAYSALVNAACVRCHEDTLLTVNGMNNHFHNFLPQTTALLAQGKQLIGASFGGERLPRIDVPLTCTSCHLAHKTVDTSDPTLKLVDVPTAEVACNTCHSIAGD